MAGEPAALVPGVVAQGRISGTSVRLADFSVARGGMLIYRADRADVEHQLTWVDRAGKPQAPLHRLP